MLIHECWIFSYYVFLIYYILLFFNFQVSNAQEELLEWHASNAKNSPNILHASERCAAGIIQAIGHYGLGPCISPRDELDSSIYSNQFMNPEFEVVYFYMAFEKWQRGEVEKSEQFIQNLKSKFVRMI